MRRQSGSVPLTPDVSLDALDLPARLRNVLRRADIRRLGELVLMREAAFYALRGARRSDWPAVQHAQLGSGIDPLRVPLIYLPLPSSLVTLLLHQHIRSVGELLALPNAEVGALPGLSATEHDAIRRALAFYGLEVRAADGE